MISKIQGCLICGAIGDALGRSVEGEPPPKRRWTDKYRKWHGWKSGPIGTITDDTQMTMWLAESLIDNNGINPEDLAERFTKEQIRGIGSATRQSLNNYKIKKMPWNKCGVDSAGNGAAMRSSPIGIFYINKLDELKNAAKTQTIITHNNSMAVASSIVVATAIAALLHKDPSELIPIKARIEFCADLAHQIEGVEDDTEYMTRDRNIRKDNLYNRIKNSIPELLTENADPLEVNNIFWSGAYVLESLPFALYCFLYTPRDFRQTLLNSVNYSKDSDTVATIACSFSGALNGVEAIEPYYVEELEIRDRLIDIAERMIKAVE